MRRWSAPLILLLVVGLFIACILSLPLARSDFRPGSTHSTREAGAAALELWLGELGYTTARMEHREFKLTPADHALFVITPQENFMWDEVDEALRWVREDGGTLIVITEGQLRLLGELEIEISQESLIDGRVQAAQPLAHPPATGISVERAHSIFSSSANSVALLQNHHGTLLAALAEGRGLIYIASYRHLASNHGLHHEQNAAVVLNLLNRVPQGGRVVFDEIHHGFKLEKRNQNQGDQEASSLLSKPVWWGLIYAALILGLFALLTGRRFGKPVPLRADIALRSSAEYAQSMAGLLERGKQTGYVLNLYKEQLKRRLARQHGFNPRVSDAEFVRELARFQPLDQDRLAQLLQSMSRSAVDPATLLQLVNEADALEREIEAARLR